MAEHKGKNGALPNEGSHPFSQQQINSEKFQK
jgi:hypothetical protein